MLSEEPISRAILHLSEIGDTDILPPLFEFKFYSDESSAIVKALSAYNPGQYKPKSAFEVLSPKTRLSFRIAHQLYAIDTLLYTASIIQLAPDIEKLRVSSEQGAFSYRYAPDMSKPQLFERDSSFHNWLVHVQELCGKNNPFQDPRTIVETDISDFYARIYFHRVEHVLDDIGAPNSVRRIIEQIIKSTRARQSHGLPVGTAASRLLAEAIMNDTDRLLLSKGLEFSRYVDDFRLMVSDQQASHTILCQLAEHLMLTEGLSLNASKTRITDTKTAADDIEIRLTDVFTSNELESLNRYIRSVYADEEEIDLDKEPIEKIDSGALVKKLVEILSRDVTDYSSIKVILKALRATGGVDPSIVAPQFGQLLYYVPRDFCLFVGSLAQRDENSARILADALLDLSLTAPYSEMALSRIWLGHLFISDALPLTRARFDKLAQPKTVIEARQRWLMLALLEDRATIRAQKTKLAEASDWEKPALLLAASCLAKSEFETWLGVAKDHLTDPLTGEFIGWLKSNHGRLREILHVDYWRTDPNFEPPKAYV